jgi:hypothetical protein
MEKSDANNLLILSVFQGFAWLHEEARSERLSSCQPRCGKTSVGHPSYWQVRRQVPSLTLAWDMSTPRSGISSSRIGSGPASGGTSEVGAGLFYTFCSIRIQFSAAAR